MMDDGAVRKRERRGLPPSLRRVGLGLFCCYLMGLMGLAIIRFLIGSSRELTLGRGHQELGGKGGREEDGAGGFEFDVMSWLTA